MTEPIVFNSRREPGSFPEPNFMGKSILKGGLSSQYLTQLYTDVQSTIRKIDPELAKNYEHDGVQIMFVDKPHTLEMILPKENTIGGQAMHRICWERYGALSPVMSQQAREKCFPFVVLIPEGYSSYMVNITNLNCDPLAQEKQPVKPLGAYVIIGTEQMRVIPGMFKKDEHSQDMFKYVTMLAMVVREGYRLGDESCVLSDRKITKGDLQDIIDGSCTAQRDANICSNEIRFLENYKKSCDPNKDASLISALSFVIRMERCALSDFTSQIPVQEAERFDGLKMPPTE